MLDAQFTGSSCRPFQPAHSVIMCALCMYSCSCKHATTSHGVHGAIVQCATAAVMRLRQPGVPAPSSQPPSLRTSTSFSTATHNLSAPICLKCMQSLGPCSLEPHHSSSVIFVLPHFSHNLSETKWACKETVQHGGGSTAREHKMYFTNSGNARALHVLIPGHACMHAAIQVHFRCAPT